MMRIIEIEPSNKTQVEAAAAFLTVFFAEEGFSTPPELIRKNLTLFLESDATAVFLAKDGETAVGVATVTVAVGVELGRAAELEDLYVLPESRNQGAARRLINAVQDWCKQRNCGTLAIVITPEGEAKNELSGFYKNLGFSETNRRIMFCKLS